jgi:hypothetical protein
MRFYCALDWRSFAALAGINLLAACAQDKEFDGIDVSRGSKDNKPPYIYNAVGSLDFEGQDPIVKASKVMLAACPQGEPTLMLADAPRFQTETSNRSILVAIFTCNQLIPGVE